jgi:protein involved in polysaccharide export with SLBB domain
MRNITLVRNNKPIAHLDMYDFLTKGEAKGNLRLQDQDIIRVPPFDSRIELAGEVKRPGIYEALNGQTLMAMLTYAGGFTDNAYKDRIKVYRNTARERSVADVDSAEFRTFAVQSGDIFTIGTLLNRFTNRVEISGAVFRPGFFALENNLTLKDLIAKADGPTEDAFASRGIIYRLKPDNTQEVLSFNLNDVIAGKTDIPLLREDKVIIASKLELREAYTVTISGEVMHPGDYEFGENMTVEDLIIAAGGLKEAASTKVEIARRIRSGAGNAPDAPTTAILHHEITRDLTNGQQKLQPFDQVTIFPDPGYSVQKRVTIKGEVLYPGQYSISKKNERLSDLLKRAGGLTATAFVEGAVLIRSMRQGEVESLLRKKKLDALEKQSTDTTKSKAIVDKELTSQSGMVGIDLAKILKKAGSSYDLVLEENDIIQIPKQLQTVQVSGEVLYPMRVKFDDGKGMRSYVSGAGGYTSKALKKRSYVVYANGTAASTKHFLVFNFYPKVKPGSEVFIPVREERRKVSAVEVASIATSTATLALLIFTLFR